MPTKPDPTIESPIWNQWLRSLSGQVEFEERVPLNRLESLQLITLSSPDSSTFYARIGTAVSRSTRAHVIIVFKQSAHDKELIVSNLPKPQAVKALQLFPELSPSKHISSIRLNSGIPYQDMPPMRVVTCITLNSSGDPIFLVAVRHRALPPIELKYMETVNDLVNFKQEIKATSTSLSTQIKQNQSLVHHLSEGLMILDRNFMVTTWNRPLQRLTGFPLKEVANISYYKALQKADGSPWLDKPLKDYHKEDIRHLFADEFQIKTKNKTAKWVSLSGTFLQNEDGELEQVIIIVRDISRIKELENRKSEFISIATHELRTPITAIKGYLSMLEKNNENLNDKQRLYLHRAGQANDRLVRLAEDLLQVVQVEENRLIFNLKPTNASEIINKAISEFQQKAHRKGLALSFKKPEFSSVIAVDPIRFEQIITNLIDNAIKYTSSGHIDIVLMNKLDNQSKIPLLSIEIRDTGQGMNDTELAHIFDKFHRTSQAELGQESGAGLGLFIVKSFIEKQQGKISVKSRVSFGSVFTITFPLINE